DFHVTGVQTCALPILAGRAPFRRRSLPRGTRPAVLVADARRPRGDAAPRPAGPVEPRGPARRGRSVRPPLRRVRHVASLFPGTPRRATPVGPLPARRGRDDLPGARPEGEGLARDAGEQPVG